MALRILLTGASGFVGRPLLAALAARTGEVHAVARQAGQTPGVHWHGADLLLADEAAALIRDVRPTHLVHAAWYVAHGKFWTAPENQDWLEASTALAAHFFESGGRRLVGIGSCAEYASRAEDDHRPWPETRLIAPSTPYGRAKAELARRLFAMAADRHAAEVAWARLFLLFGPGEQPARLMPSIIDALLAGRPANCASGRPVRDFASTWFVGAAVAALTHGAVRGAVNIGSGQPLAIADLARLVADKLGRPDLLRLGRLRDRPEDIPAMVADTTRLRQEVGYVDDAGVERDIERLIVQLRSKRPRSDAPGLNSG